MTTRGNALTIIKKEFARFFGDKQLIFSAVIMPGLLIYIIYSMMGSGIERMVNDGENDTVVLKVQNMPESLGPVIDEAMTDNVVVTPAGDEISADVALLSDKDTNMVLLRFPEAFDSLVACYTPQSMTPAPNVQVYYNSANNSSSRVYTILTAALTAYEESFANRFDVNRPTDEVAQYDMATPDAIASMVWSKILPMLIMMMLFSGTMAIAPSAIAGEKERGTIATLLVTPMRRSELALGKIVSLSVLSLLSGISSFIGIALSLPKMIPAGDAGDILNFNYVTSDYVALLFVILASALLMATMLSLLSGLAKDMKNAGTMVVPFMLVIMLAGLLPMFQNATATNPAVYLIPFYNAIECMTAIFSHELSWLFVLVTVAANVAYAFIGVWLLTRMFNSEKIMFNSK
ncbi:MAG: ABC transporter permease [Bacteroidales bacterium]|nr:ABC transporter permease [Bacteroidales bacterium]